jgi:hypothetical protein
MQQKYDLNPEHYWKYWPENEKEKCKKEQFAKYGINVENGLKKTK